MLEASEITKTYVKNGESIHAVKAFSREFRGGNLCVVYGPSGSGKTTLLMMLGGMLAPDEGSVRFKGGDLYALSRRRIGAYRQRSVGFVFQRFCLLPYLSVYKNIALPLKLIGEKDAHRRTMAISERFGLTGRLGHFPAELSVGQQQRAALARALVGNPDVLLADEPTGNLDSQNAGIVADALREESLKGKVVVVVTHDRSLKAIGDDAVELLPASGEDAGQAQANAGPPEGARVAALKNMEPGDAKP